ncbi:MAG: hypothetical protein P8Q97_19210 [Myxococcota bacterium]|nr:hypothetical protein [Myxococcota bacterium]
MGLLVLTMGGLSCEAENEPEARSRAGWERLMLSLDEARDGLDSPLAFPPEGSDRNLAEGYRYLLGHLVRVIEGEIMQDPDHPYFQRSVSMLSKWTIDNADTLYLKARIDADGQYRIRARAADTSEWASSERGLAGPKAPRLVIFQTITELIGQTGDLREMGECRNQTVASLNSFDLEIDDQGEFEILIGAERPAGYEGNFLRTRAELACGSSDSGEKEKPEKTWREARFVSVREIFSDWTAEEALELSIERLDKIVGGRPPPKTAEMAERMTRIGERVSNQVWFWNQLHEFGLEVDGDRNLDGKRAMPINSLNDPRPPFIAGGVAGARQLYGGGLFELEEDQALVLRVDLRGTDPHYVGFHLSNFWGESLDQATYATSLTGSQLGTAEDGARYYVVAAQDPGLEGWVDTTGHARGSMTLRLVYRAELEEDELPRVEAVVTSLADLREHLPRTVRTVSAEERRAQVAGRQAHIQRRYRQY